MQAEPQLVNNGLSVVGGIVIAIAAAFGVGNLVLAAYNRYASKKDKTSDAHETNAGKVIDQDQNAFNSMDKRLNALTERFDDLQQKYAELMAEHRSLLTEAKFVKEERDRLRERVNDLGAELNKANQTINDLRRELDLLKLTVANFHNPVMDGEEPVQIRIVDAEGKDK